MWWLGFGEDAIALDHQADERLHALGAPLSDVNLVRGGEHRLFGERAIIVVDLLDERVKSLGVQALDTQARKLQR